MSDTFKQGDRVTWHSSHGTVFGKVIKEVTEPFNIKGHHANASPESPQYLVESDHTGAQALHKPESLKKI